MTHWKLRISGRAEAETRSAFLWYLERNARAADRFEAAIEESVAAILETPEAFPELESGVRRRLVGHRFPYGILYRVLNDEVQIVAVMHLHRRPGYWKNR